ncbi:MAG: hypothetical protein INF43_00935 [Alphaproteobacteria bacterium]|nr:hypothetical protein [Alphaproteobacteria bacterium]
MQKVMLAIALMAGLGNISHAQANPEPVTEIVVFEVTHVEDGLAASRGIIEDAKAFNPEAIIFAETFQSSTNPSRIAQRIVWRSAEDAQAAQAASEKFPHMSQLMGLTSATLVFDLFKPLKSDQ